MNRPASSPDAYTRKRRALRKLITFSLCLTLAAGLLLSHPLSALADCPTFMEGVKLGTAESGLLTEVSGLVASRQNTGAFSFVVTADMRSYSRLGKLAEQKGFPKFL